MTTAPALVLERLDVRYRLDRPAATKNEVHALKDINLRIEAGEAVGLIGHNGSGKSTLMRVCAGLVRPTNGSILVSSQPRLLGVQAALNARLTGRRNIELGCLALGLSPAETAAMHDPIADFTELGDFLDTPVDTYSTGMAQRLAFAIATVSPPQILLVDEALAVGDHEFKSKCLERLRQIRDRSGTVIIATHSMGEVRRTCSRAIWLHGGIVQADGEPDDIIEAYEASDLSINRSLS